MSDSYQATYDAVRSRISNGDVGAAVTEVAREAFQFSWLKAQAEQVMSHLHEQYARPTVLMRPRVFLDGNQWCALYGENIQEGVCGFGDSPADATEAFDEAWVERTSRAKAKRITDQICGAVKDAIS